MSEFTHLNRQFISWFGSLPPHELMDAYAKNADGAECEDRFFDSHRHALIHTETRGMPEHGEFRLGQSSKSEFVLTPINGKVIVRKIHDPESIDFVFSNVGAFLEWMLEPAHQVDRMALVD